MTTAAVGLGALGPADGSSLLADNNMSSAATGNGATNSLNISATRARTSAGLNNVESGDGEIRVLAGDSLAPLGVVLYMPGTVRYSDLAMRGDLLTGGAIRQFGTMPSAVIVSARSITAWCLQSRTATSSPLPLSSMAGSSVALTGN